MPSTSAQTQAVLARHTQALMSGDMDAVMRNFAEDAAVFIEGETIRGREQIRAFLEQGMNNLPPGYMDAFEVLWQDFDGPVAYLVYKAEPFVALGTDTWVVRDDKIIAQTYTAYPAYPAQKRAK